MRTGIAALGVVMPGLMPGIHVFGPVAANVLNFRRKAADHERQTAQDRSRRRNGYRA